MLTVKFGNIDLSRIGFGSRRLPLNEEGLINVPMVEAMVDYSMEKGVNFFNTGYTYHKMQAEGIIIKALSKYPRNTYFLADSYPGYNGKEDRDPKRIFEEQISKSGVGYFDFYRLQNVYGQSFDYYYDDTLGIVKYFIEQKNKGRIKHLGFSAHGSPYEIKKFLNKFGDEMEFAQIEMNYIGWTLRQAEKKYEMLALRNIPVFVIEPMHGGRLAHLDPEDEFVLKSFIPDRSPKEIGFRWIESFPNVKVIISSMSSFNQVQQNLSLFEKKHPLSSSEIKSVGKFAEHLMKGITCNECGFCVENCPYSLDIPSIVHLYSDIKFSSLDKAVKAAIMLYNRFPGKNLHRCKGCGVCKLVCARQNDIPKIISDVRDILGHCPGLEDILKVRNSQQQ